MRIRFPFPTSRNDQLRGGSGWNRIEKSLQQIAGFINEKYPSIESDVEDLKIACSSAYVVDSSADDISSAINAAFEDNDAVIVPQGDYTTATTISVPTNKTLIVYGDITYTGTGAAIELTDVMYCLVYVKKVQASNGTCIRVKSDTDLNEFNEIHSVYLYGKNCIEVITTGTRGCQHINFYSNYIRATEKGISITASNANAWNGEIKFFGGEINGSSATGLYTNGAITAIRMFGIGFESLTTAINITNGGNEVTLYGCRFEGAGQIILAGTFRACIFDGDIFSYGSLDVTNHAGSTIFRGRIMSAPNGNQIGNEMIITGSVPTITGTIDNTVAYAIYSNGATIGGNGIFPVVARLNATDGIYYLSDKYQINGCKSLIVFCEKTNITLKNADGSKTLFTSGNTQECYRITSISNNNSYFCPTSYLVEKITPIK